tara:strand:+ start:24973 stop:26406 length:1434 start_codon:yes stop_codon:yes gene_type:complete
MIKRPQPKKAMPVVKRPPVPAVTVSASASVPATSTAQQHGIDYYRSTADDDAAILEDRRQRQYEERQRKKDMKKFQKQFGYWNPMAPHKPERYSNLKAYRASGGYTRKKEDFNAFLRKAATQERSREASDESSASHPASSSSQPQTSAAPKLSFAPPASYGAPSADASAAEESGEVAYARRMRLAQQQHVPSTPPPPPPNAEPQANARSADSTQAPPPPPPPVLSGSSAYSGATISAPPVRYHNATISAPPVRYERPDVPMGDVDEPAYEERPVKRPRITKAEPKITKAEAMMAKMGYVKGQGLGKNNDGVVTHLEVKKRKVGKGGNTIDDEGGKGRSQQVWDVRGGHRNQNDEPGQFGEESCVVVTWGCVEGIDWDENAQRNDGGIRQDMGQVFSAKVCQPNLLRKSQTKALQFGTVEHIQIDESNKDGVVYVKFESVMSALNAVNRFDEGYEYRGRKIRARYYDERKFNAGIWEH